MNEDRRIFTANQMAQRLGVTIRWLKQEAEAGRVPAIRAESRFLFNPDAVQEALLHRASEPQA